LAGGDGLLHFRQYQFFEGIAVDSAPDVPYLFIKQALVRKCFFGFFGF
jgi:hypothetical protein